MKTETTTMTTTQWNSFAQTTQAEVTDAQLTAVYLAWCKTNGTPESFARAILALRPQAEVPDSSEHLRVIASLGAALRRLSFAAQTTGGTAGPDAELQSAIGQAGQALSLGGIGQAMSATPEPVVDVRCEGCGYMTHHREHMGCVRAAKQHTQPAPSAAVTPEPVASRNPFASRCYAMSESHLAGHRLIVGFEKLEDAQDAHEWVARQGRGDFTHPSPSVDGDVVRVPVQVLKDASEALGNFVSDHGWGDADMQAMDNLDAYIARHEAIDAAMLAAK